MDYQDAVNKVRQEMKNGVVTSADEANVRIIEYAQVVTVEGSMQRSVRKALNAAVKSGRLGKIKKDKFSPEIFYCIGFEELAKQKKNEIALRAINSISKVVK